MNWTRALKRRFGLRKKPAPEQVVAVQRLERFKQAMFAADAARDRRDWLSAADSYGEALAIDGAHPDIRIQYGHALKEAGRWHQAGEAYQQAADALPEEAQVLLHLGHVLKLQHRADAAIEAYVEALRRDPGLAAARDELIAIGARDRLSGEVYGRSAVEARLSRLSTAIDATLSAVRDGAAALAFPVGAWDAFKRQYPVAPPPKSAVTMVVVLDARGRAPSGLRTTLLSLIDQRHETWKAVVVTDQAIADHPVASLARIDARIALAPANAGKIAKALGQDSAAPVLLLSSGARLDPEAVGWFAFALERTGADAAYSDHDHFEMDWRSGPIWLNPVLHSMPDRHDMAGTPQPPTAIALAAPLRAVLMKALTEPGEVGERLRTLVLDAIDHGPVAHLPRVLISQPVAEESTEALRASAVEASETGDARILVVVPTRDQSELLARCVETFLDRAARPDLLRFRVVDNRSVEPATKALLSRLVNDFGAEVLTADEPFNWARLNNLAVEDRAEEIYLFANNDTEMLTHGWDERLRAWLRRPDIGVVGARLLYPDDTLQHGGILMGAYEGRPLHEGLQVARTDGGPLGRWRRSRAVGAVTGAFMACRRDTHRSIAGFDSILAIAYNDIDYCLRSREANLKVVYAADIELIHHEGLTRGRNDVAEKLAWDDGELFHLHARWGAAMLRDPGLNPHWASAGQRAFDGYKAPPASEILGHLDASATRDPWAIPPSKVRTAAQAGSDEAVD